MNHDTQPDFRLSDPAQPDDHAAQGPDEDTDHSRAGSALPGGLSPREHWRSLPKRSLRVALYVLPLVALANVAVLVWSLGGVELSRRLVAPEFLGLAALVVLIPMLVNSARLAIWGRFLGLDLSFARALKVMTGTMVTNSVTPSATGGTPIKLLFLLGEGVPPRRATTLISFQVAEDAIVLFSLAGLSLAVTGFTLLDFLGSEPALLIRFEEIVQSAGLAVAGALVALAALAGAVVSGLLGDRVRGWADRLFARGRGFVRHVVVDWVAVLRRGKAVALANIGLASVQWAARFSIAGLVLAAFGVEWRPALFWLLQYCVQSISSLVPTPGGAGGAEAGFLLLFAPVIDVDVLVPAMSAWRLIFFYFPLAAAALIFFLLHRAAHRAARESAPMERVAPPHPAE